MPCPLSTTDSAKFLRQRHAAGGIALGLCTPKCHFYGLFHLRGAMRLLFSLFAGLLAVSAPAFAECQGKNLIAALSPAAQTALRAKADESAFAVGNYWQATKADETITLIGTYHLDDPRHAKTMVRLAPVLATARTLLVEAGPAEEESLKQRIADDPSLIVNTKGPTLPEVLPKTEWEKLADAAADRGVPAFMLAKFRPWYVSILLSMPPCSLDEATPHGLDAQLIAAAQAQNLPVKALEPYDTLFGIFDKMTHAEQLDMITTALAFEGASADLAVTMADSYFSEEGRLIWEFNRLQALQLPGYSVERVDREFASMEQSMMIDRNRAWIPVIETAARKGPLLVAFGALHLSGDQGVLNLLQADGYQIRRLSLQ